MINNEKVVFIPIKFGTVIFRLKINYFQIFSNVWVGVAGRNYFIFL